MSASKKATRKKSATSDKQDPISFETAMQELEQLVARLEQGELSLDQSLKDFERGVALTRICQRALTEAEQKVQILSRDQGQESLVAFDSEDSDS